MIKGQHGVIRNKAEVEISGTVVVCNSAAFEFAIDGAKYPNTFESDDWDFIPDPTPLPTGLWSVIVGPDDEEGWAPYILTEGGWVRLKRDGSGTYRETEAGVRTYIDEYGFRVVHEGEKEENE